MTIKKSLKSEIDNLDDRYLAERYRIVKAFTQAKSTPIDSPASCPA